MECSSSYQKENMKSEVDFEEPMDTNETQCSSNFEEGEIFNSDDEEDIFDQKETSNSSIFTRKNKKDHDHGFVLGFNLFDENEVSKKLDRAKRFALPINIPTTDISKEQLIDLYKDLGINKENERHYRFNAVHMRGVQNMNSENVLDYFMPYTPSHIEWINDTSCNVVWVDDISCARALLNTSKKIKTSKEVRLGSTPFEKDFESKSEKVNNDSFLIDKEMEETIPPGFWRVGLPTKKSPLILLRYASRSDKKQHCIDKISECKKKYTNISFDNPMDLPSNSCKTDFKKSKHKMKSYGYLPNVDESVYDEVVLNGQKNPWVELAYEWGRTDKVEEDDSKFTRNRIPVQHNEYLFKSSVPDLRLSLINKNKRNYKRERVSYGEESSNSSDVEILESRNKIPRMKMYADDEEKRLEKNFDKNSQKSRINKKIVKDLRIKINSKKNKAKLGIKSDKREQEKFHSKGSYSENEYDDEDSGEWALEHYHDLRESLDQNKKREQKNSRVKRYKSESEGDEDEDEDENVVGHNVESYDDDDDDDDDDDNERSNKKDSLINFGHISPLQIEIDNDEYYQSLKNK